MQSIFLKETRHLKFFNAVQLIKCLAKQIQGNIQTECMCQECLGNGSNNYRPTSDATLKNSEGDYCNRVLQIFTDLN